MYDTYSFTVALVTCPCNPPASSISSPSKEDCKVLAEVLDSAASKKSPSESVDVPAVLAEYNERRFGDAIAACSLSEIMGKNQSKRLAFAAQLMLTTLLNKTLGRFAPKVRVPELRLFFVVLLSPSPRSSMWRSHQ